MSIPTLHPAIVHFPIALLLLASTAALTYMYGQPRPELKILTWWSMVLGWLALVIAVISGLFAQGGLPPDAPYRATLNGHITTGLLLVVLYGELLYRRWLTRKPRRDRRRRPGSEVGPSLDFLDDPQRRWLLTGELILGIGLVVAAGWFGGELVYRWGVNVRG